MDFKNGDLCGGSVNKGNGSVSACCGRTAAVKEKLIRLADPQCDIDGKIINIKNFSCRLYTRIHLTCFGGFRLPYFPRWADFRNVRRILAAAEDFGRYGPRKRAEIENNPAS